MNNPKPSKVKIVFGMISVYPATKVRAKELMKLGDSDGEPFDNWDEFINCLLNLGEEAKTKKEKVEK